MVKEEKRTDLLQGSSSNSTKDITEIEDPTSSTATNEFTVSPSSVSRPQLSKLDRILLIGQEPYFRRPRRMSRTDRLGIVIRISSCI